MRAVIPAACKWFVLGTLGRLNVNSLLLFLVASCMPSLGTRLPMRVLGRFSALSLPTGLESLLGLSDGAVIARVSCFGGLGVFEDECLR